MADKKLRTHLFSTIFSIVLALLKWGVTRTWNIATFWSKERKKPLPDRQKIDRMKAFAGLAAIGLAVGIAAWFAVGLMASATATVAAAFLSRQHALYIGLGLLIVGLNVARLMPNRRKIGLLLMAAGALLCAYGLGYLG